MSPDKVPPVLKMRVNSFFEVPTLTYISKTHPVRNQVPERHIQQNEKSQFAAVSEDR